MDIFSKLNFKETQIFKYRKNQLQKYVLHGNWCPSRGFKIIVSFLLKILPNNCNAILSVFEMFV